MIEEYKFVSGFNVSVYNTISVQVDRKFFFVDLLHCFEK